MAGGLLALTVLAEVASVALSWRLEAMFDTLAYAAYAVVTAWAGFLVVARHPRHPVGWLLIGFALVNAAAADAAQGWGLRAAAEHWAGAAAAELVATSSWLVSGLGWTLTFLLFPTGHLLARRWAVVAWLSAAGVLLALPGWSLSPDRREEFSGGVNPYAVAGLPHEAMLLVGMALVVGGLVASGVSLLIRLRRSTGVERQQIKLFAYAGVVTVVCLPVSFALWYVAPATRVLAAFALCTLPIAACVAILRHRLYDVDVLIDRTVVYLGVTVVLASSFAAVVLVVGTLLGQGSPWGTAAATLVVAVAFQPLRSRLQGVVDRTFHAPRFHALQRAAAFLEDLRAGRVAPEDLRGLLRQLLDDPELELVVFLPQSEIYVDVSGRPVPDDVPLGPAGATLQVLRGDAPLGLLLLSERVRDADDPSLAQRVLDTVGLAVEILRLHVELRRQLVEVQESRTRIVAASLEERRRLERDLHDGAQQRLVSIGLALRHAQHQLVSSGPDRPGQVSTTLDAAVQEVAATIEELRELARGLPPAQLDQGLAPAFLDLARRAPLPVLVTAPAERFERGLEGAAYFIGCEALTNAVKHARASRVRLDATRRDGHLVVTVADDGVGGAAAVHGSGLSGLADRVAALGGVLHIASVPGDGTTVTAELPCGS